MLAWENLKFLRMVGLSKALPLKMERFPANGARLLGPPCYSTATFLVGKSFPPTAL